MAATMHYDFKPDETSAEKFPLRDPVRKRVQQYYRSVNQSGIHAKDVYQLIMEETEWPMIEATMEFTGYNQSQSARILGLNRGTFRKKLQQYHMLQEPDAKKSFNPNDKVRARLLRFISCIVFACCPVN